MEWGTFESVRYEIKKKRGSSENTAQDLYDETRGPFIIEEFRKKHMRKHHVGGYMNLLAGY